MSDWNSNQYMKFADERLQPSKDLISRLDGCKPENILDLGCGTGISTYALKERFRTADITGADASDNMLEKARKSYPDINFRKCILPQQLDEISGKYDLIFSNACIHWIPEQEKLIEAVIEKLNHGGTLAVQLPYIQEAPFYRILYRLIDKKWHKLSSIRNFYNLLPEQYFDLLSTYNVDFRIWETVYYHTVSSYSGIIEWYKGSGLRPYLEALDNDEREAFTADILNEIEKTYPVQKNSQVILKMPRIFFTALKK